MIQRIMQMPASRFDRLDAYVPRVHGKQMGRIR
jgi:hypothetical protein